MIMTTIQSAGAIHGRPAASHKITPGYYPTSLHEYQPQPQAQPVEDVKWVWVTTTDLNGVTVRTKTRTTQ